MVLVSVRYLFYQPMGEKIKTLTLRFPAEEKPDTGKALFDYFRSFVVSVLFALFHFKVMGK